MTHRRSLGLPMLRTSAIAALALLLVAVLGCQTLFRSIMSSASIASAMSSLQSSSNMWAANDDLWAQNIAALTSTAARADTERATFLRDLGRVAAEHGVIDWETRDVTFLAIGVGLKSSGLGEDEARAFEHALFGGDERALGLILEGYRRS